MVVAEGETEKLQDGGLVDSCGSATFGENSASHNQVIEQFIACRIRKQVNSVVAAVENRFHDAISTAMDYLIIPKIEISVRSVLESSERGANGIVQNPVNREFSAVMENTPLMTASSRTDLIIDQDRNDETCNGKILADGIFRHLNLILTGKHSVITDMARKHGNLARKKNREITLTQSANPVHRILRKLECTKLINENENFFQEGMWRN